jgi:gamma-glutamylcyclotransferase (GGCT)/AIG2-like uncharacterized protein YtfP
MNKTAVVFVYGTLRKGLRFHHLLRNAAFLGMAKTRDEYALYLAEYPCLFKEEPVSRITGEVYEVDLPTLAVLDELEEHPHLYRREQVPVILADEQNIPAWVYFFPCQTGTLEPCGDYTKCCAI